MAIERIGGPTSANGGQTFPFCQAAKAGGWVFVSGQIAMNAEGEVVGGIVAQTHEVMGKIVAILEKAGCTLVDVVKMNIWLDDPRDFASFNRTYASYFDDRVPARACVRSALMADCKVEIDAVAYRE